MLNKKSKFEKNLKFKYTAITMSKFLTSVDEVVEPLFDDDFSFSEGDSSDEEGKGIFAYAGQAHIDAAEVAALSRGVVSIPIDSTTGRSVPEGDGRGNKCATDSKGQEDEFSGKNKRDNRT